jgi:hypothetical protein
MDTFADRVARLWAGIERGMKLANRNSAFRPQIESLINIYFDLIDEMAAELERRRRHASDIQQEAIIDDENWRTDLPVSNRLPLTISSQWS